MELKGILASALLFCCCVSSHKYSQVLSLPVSKMGITMPYEVGEDQTVNTSSVLSLESCTQ